MFGVDTSGSDRYDVHVVDVRRGWQSPIAVMYKSCAMRIEDIRLGYICILTFMSLFSLRSLRMFVTWNGRLIVTPCSLHDTMAISVPHGSSYEISNQLGYDFFCICVK